MLDGPAYDRAQAFFDGQMDGVYGPAAGERARDAIRESLEAASRTDGLRRPRSLTPERRIGFLVED
ncbi:MAG TPA: hypothetical protein VLV81_08650 [Acidimicrobiia bacterium]|nr:hypothetical protein [Acidimicrobiia bacterium]